MTWALEVEHDQLKPGERMCLVFLANCHNPIYGCFPSQGYLAEKLNVQRSTVGDYLTKLERLGLIRRAKKYDKATKQRENDRYFLLMGEAKSHVGISDIDPQKPCRDYPKSHVGISDSKLVKETLNTATSAREVLPPAEKQQQVFSEGFYEDLLQVLRVQPKGWWSPKKGPSHVAKWIAAGLSEDQILSVARANAATFTVPPDGPKALDTAMKAELAKAPAAAASAPASDWLAVMANNIKTFAYVPPSAVSIQRAQELLARSLVTTDDLRRHGIAH